MWSAVAQRYNAGFSIERARVRIPFALVSKLHRFCSLHVALVHSAVFEYLAINSGGNMSERSSRSNCSAARILPSEVELVPE